MNSNLVQLYINTSSSDSLPAYRRTAINGLGLTFCELNYLVDGPKKIKKSVNRAFCP